MSIVPSITCSRKRRDFLNNRRNTFTFIANLVVLGSATTLFAIVSDSEKAFNYLAYITEIFGVCTSFFFIMQIKEVKLSKECEEI